MPIPTGAKELAFPIRVTCCCCKRTVLLDEPPQELQAALSGWLSIERKAFCDECVAQFTEEDREWCTEAPVPFGVAEIAHLLPGDVEPL